jgi:hypothetical protein
MPAILDKSFNRLVRSQQTDEKVPENSQGFLIKAL